MELGAFFGLLGVLSDAVCFFSSCPYFDKLRAIPRVLSLFFSAFLLRFLFFSERAATTKWWLLM